MDPAQYIDSIALDEALLRRVADLAAEALRKLEARKQETQALADAALVVRLKQQLFVDTFADTHESIAKAVDTIIAECDEPATPIARARACRQCIQNKPTTFQWSCPWLP